MDRNQALVLLLAMVVALLSGCTQMEEAKTPVATTWTAQESLVYGFKDRASLSPGRTFRKTADTGSIHISIRPSRSIPTSRWLHEQGQRVRPGKNSVSIAKAVILSGKASTG